MSLPGHPPLPPVDTTGRDRAGAVGLHIVQSLTEPVAGRVPASAAWRAGDPVGDRLFHDVGPLDLEVAGTLPDVTLAYETWGTLSPSGDNAVIVLHALSGDSHVTGPAGPGHPTAGWWQSMVGPGRPIDTDRFFVVAPNVLGGCQGSTGPASPAPDGRPWGARFPAS